MATSDYEWRVIELGHYDFGRTVRLALIRRNQYGKIEVATFENETIRIQPVEETPEGQYSAEPPPCLVTYTDVVGVEVMEIFEALGRYAEERKHGRIKSVDAEKARLLQEIEYLRKRLQDHEDANMMRIREMTEATVLQAHLRRES